MRFRAGVRDVKITSRLCISGFTGTTMTDTWAIGAALGPVVAVQESAKRFPHIKTGEEFTRLSVTR